MSNFSIKHDLLRLKGAFVTNLKGKTGTVKKCLIIPVEDAGLYLGEKGCYLNTTAIELREPKFSDTHCIKPDLAKELRESMSEEERKAVPILGGMHPIEKQQQQMSVTGMIDAVMAVEDEDELPF